jgi:hypothetical protein
LRKWYSNVGWYVYTIQITTDVISVKVLVGIYG